jgi:hypothetical protein
MAIKNGFQTGMAGGVLWARVIALLMLAIYASGTEAFIMEVYTDEPGTSGSNQFTLR